MNKILPDVQKIKVKDSAIPRVGEENIDFQFKVFRKGSKEYIDTQALVNVYQWCDGHRKGINMSRIMEVLMEERDKPLNKKQLRSLLIKMLERMEKKNAGNARDVYIEIHFKYFMAKEAPASKKIGLLGYKCTFYGKLIKTNVKDKYTFIHALGVDVPVTTLCPCSKEISKYGAHNQRSYIKTVVQLFPDKSIWLEDLIKLLEKQGACEIFSLLKREDEKYVTEKAYENPAFVEDVNRKTRKALEALKEIKKFKFKVINEESIHTHNAVSWIKRIRKGNSWITPLERDII